MKCVRSIGLLVFLSAAALGAETFAPEPDSGPPTLTAAYPIDGQAAAVIGKLKVAGTGRVTFFASRQQSRLMLKAVGAGRAPLGSAESTVGLGDTPIYIKTPKGLFKVLIHWSP